MALDLSTIPPATRKKLILAGRKFSSEDTLAQAEQTLKALETYAPKLAEHGFGADDVQELKDGRDELYKAGVGRETKRADKKTTSKTYVDTLRIAQQTRLRARSVLSNTQRALMRVEGDAAADAARAIDAILDHGSVAGEDAETMAAQLDQLKTVLDNAAVKTAAEGRGGPKALADLTAQAEALRALSQTAAGPRGTPQETEKLDLIDGIILSLTRTAREAAEAASKGLGEPAMLAEFELTKLYGPAKTKGKVAGGAGAPATEAPSDTTAGGAETASSTLAGGGETSSNTTTGAADATKDTGPS
jgi:hypothetical protein